MLTGGYFRDFSPCSARFLLRPNIEPLRPKSLDEISPIVLERLWPFAGAPGVLVPVGGVCIPVIRANLGGTLTLGRPIGSLSGC